MEGAERIGRGEDPSLHSALGDLARTVRLDDDAPGATLERRRRVGAPIDVLAAEPEEQVPGRNLPRVDGPADRPISPSRLDDLGATSLDDALGGELDQATSSPDARSRASSSRATCRSSNGTFRPFANS